MQFAHNGYYKGSSPLGLISPYFEIKLIIVLIPPSPSAALRAALFIEWRDSNCRGINFYKQKK